MKQVQIECKYFRGDCKQQNRMDEWAKFVDLANMCANKKLGTERTKLAQSIKTAVDRCLQMSKDDRNDDNKNYIVQFCKQMNANDPALVTGKRNRR